MKLENLAIVLPDDPGQQIIDKFQEIVDVRANDATAAAQIVLRVDEHEAIFNSQPIAQWNRTIQPVGDRLEKSGLSGALATGKPADPRVLRDKENMVRRRGHDSVRGNFSRPSRRENPGAIRRHR